MCKQQIMPTLRHHPWAGRQGPRPVRKRSKRRMHAQIIGNETSEDWLRDSTAWRSVRTRSGFPNAQARLRAR